MHPARESIYRNPGTQTSSFFFGFFHVFPVKNLRPEGAPSPPPPPQGSPDPRGGHPPGPAAAGPRGGRFPWLRGDDERPRND